MNSCCKLYKFDVLSTKLELIYIYNHMNKLISFVQTICICFLTNSHILIHMLKIEFIESGGKMVQIHNFCPGDESSSWRCGCARCPAG